MRQIVDVFAIFPLGHALMMVPSCWAIAHPMGIANVENTDLLGLTELHNLAGAFVPQVAHLPLDAALTFLRARCSLRQRREPW